MNGKLRVAAIGLALSVTAALILLLVQPSLDPARLRWLPLLIGAELAPPDSVWVNTEDALRRRDRRRDRAIAGGGPDGPRDHPRV